MLLALLGAVKQEVDGLRKRLGLREVAAPPGRHLFAGQCGQREVLLLQTGMGRQRAGAAAEYLLGRYPVGILISLGFAGALRGDLGVGDLVLCQRLLTTNPSDGAACHSDADLLAQAARAATEAQCRWVTGDSLTADGLAADPREKLALGETSGAASVDMETYWLARAAAARRIPFLAVRAISDTLPQKLPPFERLVDADGVWRSAKATSYLLAHPAELAALPTMYRNARRAQMSLTRALCALTTNLASGSTSL